MTRDNEPGSVPPAGERPITNEILVHDELVVRESTAGGMEGGHQEAAAGAPRSDSAAAERRELRAVVHKLSDALARRCLTDANANREAPNDWPGGQSWDDLVPSSHSIMRHRAWKEAGLEITATRDLLFERGYPKAYVGDEDHPAEQLRASEARAESPESPAVPSERRAGDEEADFTQSFDAMVWAREFVRRAKEDPAIATDEGAMVGWFANAIMRGYDDAKREGREQSARSASDAPTSPERCKHCNDEGVIHSHEGEMIGQCVCMTAPSPVRSPAADDADIRTLEDVAANWERTVADDMRAAALRRVLARASRRSPSVSDEDNLKDALDLTWTHLQRLDPVLAHELWQETPALQDVLIASRRMHSPRLRSEGRDNG